ncbi:MAG: Ubiquinone biosynthesis O-methyltransferase [ANME-2 cluster archaeon]|nr:Ubiquinone biosynthesis O-methyltransferase [ANME-2 cluster archaeon]
MKQRPVSHLKAWNKEHLRGIWKGPYSLDFFDRYVTPPARILDAGCGLGRYTIPLAMREYDVTGVDISKFAITGLNNVRLRRNMQMGMAAADVCHLPFQNDTFDAVVAFGVLQHLLEEERSAALSEFARVLVPGGTIVIEVLGREDMRMGGREVENATFLRSTGSVYHYFDPDEIKDIYSGLEIIEIKENKIIKNIAGKDYTRHMISVAARSREKDI